MRTSRVSWVALFVLLVAAAAIAGDSRTYSRSIEPVWDEAVKAVRDADLELTDSSRAQHWFTMKTKAKTLSRSRHFEVRLTQSGEVTTVAVEESDHESTKKSRNIIARYFAALHERMN